MIPNDIYYSNSFKNALNYKFQRPNKDSIQDAEQFKEKHPKTTYRELIKSTTKNAHKKKQIIEKKYNGKTRIYTFKKKYYSVRKV